ncbi:hypothetical protein PG995_013531 [Apiospora arundinis]
MRFPRKSNHAPILDLVGSLSSYGINEYLDLPQIIVCGDQSSGKSSALEAISRVPFAVQDELFTRFATEIILRRQEVKDIRAFIINSSSRHNDNDNNTLVKDMVISYMEKPRSIILARRVGSELRPNISHHCDRTGNIKAHGICQSQRDSSSQDIHA